MPAPDPVVVVGAGIGGLTAALALARKGIDVVVVERRTALDESGAGIQLTPNASRVLSDLGLGPALARQASEPPRLLIRGLASGRDIGTVTLGPAMRRRFGAPYIVIRRAALQTILLDAVRGLARVRLLFGRTATGATTRGGCAHVTVSAPNGATETLQATLAVGADGLHSALRRALGDRREAAFQGSNAWRATLARQRVPSLLRGPETGLWLGPGAHLVHYPVDGGAGLNIVAVTRAERPLPDWSNAGEPGEIAARLAHAAEPVRALVQAVADWRVWSLFDLAPARPWGAGRVTLLGDAAHPVLPFLAQGAALAIEDAAVLADRLAHVPTKWNHFVEKNMRSLKGLDALSDPTGSDKALAAMPDAVEAALRAYEAARRPRARRVQQAARANGRTYHLAQPLAAARDLVIRWHGPDGMTARYDWLYGWRPDRR